MPLCAAPSIPRARTRHDEPSSLCNGPSIRLCQLQSVCRALASSHDPDAGILRKGATSEQHIGSVLEHSKVIRIGRAVAKDCLDAEYVQLRSALIRWNIEIGPNRPGCLDATPLDRDDRSCSATKLCTKLSGPDRVHSGECHAKARIVTHIVTLIASAVSM